MVLGFLSKLEMPLIRLLSVSPTKAFKFSSIFPTTVSFFSSSVLPDTSIESKYEEGIITAVFKIGLVTSLFSLSIAVIPLPSLSLSKLILETL